MVPLLLALRVCAEGAVRQKSAASTSDELISDEPTSDESAAEVEPTGGAGPDPLTVELAHTLLTGPLGGLDGSDLRRLGRALRDEERAALREQRAAAEAADAIGAVEAIDASEGRVTAHVRPSDELIRDALAHPEQLVTLDLPPARRARELGTLLRKVRELLVSGGTAEEALWDLWDGSPRWRERLERAALRPGTVGRNADRDLDALCALFETAARAEEQVTGHRGALDLLAEVEAQDIAADTLTVRTVRPEAVRLMTAHRSKGLEWRLVVVVSVQEGLWPDLRRRARCWRPTGSAATAWPSRSPPAHCWPRSAASSTWPSPGPRSV